MIDYMGSSISMFIKGARVSEYHNSDPNKPALSVSKNGNSFYLLQCSVKGAKNAEGEDTYINLKVTFFDVLAEEIDERNPQPGEFVDITGKLKSVWTGVNKNDEAVASLNINGTSIAMQMDDDKSSKGGRGKPNRAGKSSSGGGRSSRSRNDEPDEDEEDEAPPARRRRR